MISVIASLPQNALTTIAVLTGLNVAFATKHTLADFVLQTSWMVRGKEAAVGWGPPLLAHALCHAALTLVIAVATTPHLWWLALIDLAIHLAVDRSKAVLARRGGWRPDQAQFWWLLGFDQYIHQLTNVGLSATILLA